MKPLTKLFATTLLISFLGSLPLGTLNVSVTNLSVTKGVNAAVSFGLGAILVELAVIWISLRAVEKLRALKGYHKWFNHLSFLILLGLSLITLVAAVKMKKFEAALPFTTLAPFFSGTVLSALNPLHLPFWMGWNAALQANGILKATARSYTVYIASIGLGTIAAFTLYGVAGGRLITLVNDRQYIVNWVVGLSLLGTALLQLVKVLRKPAFVASVGMRKAKP